jgi:2-methylcitrate dehydratase PrpD
MEAAADLIAQWASQLGTASIPDPVRAVARACFIDTLSVALAGSQTDAAARVRSFARKTYASGQATLLGDWRRLAVPAAALVNGTAAHALDFDDNCYAGFVHGSAVIVPAVLAAAEAADVSGAALLAAFVAGAEAEYAVGKAATDSLYAKGWWTTGVLGPVGATVAAGHVLRLGPEQLAAAVGLAVAGTGGLKACFGTDGKPALCGRAAEAGVTAALLAREGVSGPQSAFEDSRGFARLFNDGTFDAEPFAALGKTWSLLDPGIDVKRIPVCLSAHAAVDAVVDLMSEYGLAGDDIASVHCDISPIAAANLVYRQPETPQQAQFSMPFAVACAMLHGTVALRHLSPEAVGDPKLRAAMDRVSTGTSERWSPGSEALTRHPEAAFVTLFTWDGRRFERFGRYARGMVQRPLSDAELDAKFIECALRVPGLDCETLLGRLRRLDGLGSARELFADCGTMESNR